MCSGTNLSDGANVCLVRLIVCLLTFKERTGYCYFRILTILFVTLNRRSLCSCFITVCGTCGVIGIWTDVNNILDWASWGVPSGGGGCSSCIIWEGRYFAVIACDNGRITGPQIIQISVYQHMLRACSAQFGRAAFLLEFPVRQTPNRDANGVSCPEIVQRTRHLCQSWCWKITQACLFVATPKYDESSHTTDIIKQLHCVQDTGEELQRRRPRWRELLHSHALWEAKEWRLCVTSQAGGGEGVHDDWTWWERRWQFLRDRVNSRD